MSKPPGWTRIITKRRFLFTAYNASFDRAFLDALLQRHGLAFDELYPYFRLDLPSMAFGAGAIALRNSEVAAAFGVPPETDDPLEHTGLSGAEWNLALYRAMLKAGQFVIAFLAGGASLG